MLYRNFAKVISWIAKTLGTTLDIRELLSILKYDGGAGVVTAAITKFLGLPLWAIIIITLAVLILLTLLLILKKRKPYSDSIRAISRMLYNMHHRANVLALKKGEKIDGNKLNENKEIFNALTSVFGVSKKQADSISKVSGKLGKRRESALVKAIEASHITESPQKLAEVAAIMEREGIGLKQICDKDFRYNFYNEQLGNLRPMPTTLINNKVDNFLDFSYVYNSLLMIQKPLLPTIYSISSTQIANYNTMLIGYVEKTKNNMLAGLHEHLEKYITEKEKDATNKK